MTAKLSLLILIILLIPGTFASLMIHIATSPDTMDIAIDKDTTLQEDYPDTNYGDSHYLMVGRYGGNRRHTILNFSVSDIPPGSTVSSARLILYYQSSEVGFTSATINAHQLYNYWTEQMASWTTRAGVIIHRIYWDNPGGDYYPRILGSAFFTIPCPLPCDCSIDLTSFVQMLVNKEVSNFQGIMLEADGSTKWLSFWSSDAPDSSKRPHLQIEYTPSTIELSASPSEQTVVQGESTTYQVVVEGTYRGNADVVCSWIAPGASGSTITTDVSSGVPPFVITVTIQTSATTPPGDYSFVVELHGTEGSPSLTPSERITLDLHVEQAVTPEFSLSVSPGSRIISPGESTEFFIDLGSIGGFSNPVTLSVTGLPSGTTHSFSANNQVPDFTSTLSISTSSTTPVGSYSITVSGTGGGITHEQTVTLEITEAARFAIMVEPSSRVAKQGGSAQYSVHVTGIGGFSDPITLGIVGLPSGATPVITVNSQPPNYDSILTITVGSETPTGTYTMYLQGVGGGLTISSNPFTLTVTSAPSSPTPTPSPTPSPSPTPTPKEFDFEVSIDPKSLSLPPSGSGTVIIELTLTSGTGEPVTLSAKGLPSDATYSLSPETLTPTGSSTLYIKAGTTPGTYTVLIKAVGGGIERSAKLRLVVQSPRKCVIATATYGSELSHEVQVLRTFRDEMIMHSFAGRQFMRVFNWFYYGWSTPVAKFLEKHNSISRCFRVLLYPLIGVLELAKYGYGLFSFNTELGVVSSGILASSLIGIVYLSPLMYLLIVKGINVKLNKLLAFSTSASLISLLVSELFLIENLAALSSSILVISLMFLAPTLLISFLTKPRQ